MLPFAFEKINKYQQTTTSSQEALLTQIFMLALQNERLTNAYNHQQYSSKDYSFQASPLSEQSTNQLKVQLELKKIQVDNLTILLNEVQQKCIVQQSKIKQQQNAFMLYQSTNKDETNQIKSQLQMYKTKYQQQLLQRSQYHKKERQFQKFLSQSKLREQDLIEKTNILRNENANLIKTKDRTIEQLEKKSKDLKKQIIFLQQNVALKEQECFSLRSSLNDAPKMQQLNRWILKVRQYQEKQMQSCAKLSQMSQQICSYKEKYRKMQHEYKQVLKIKQELERTVTTNRQNQDSMSVYFDRLSTYQNVIRDLQNQVKDLEVVKRQNQAKHNQKISALEQQKNKAITQWQTILQEMNKQRSLLHAMQSELDQYTNIKQSHVTKNVQTSQNNTSRVQENKTRQGSVKESFLARYPSLQTTNRNCLEENRINSQKIIYHSDRINNSYSRLQTQNSHESFSKESTCRDCQSRVKVGRSSSSGRVPYQQVLRQEKQATEQRIALKEKEHNIAINDSKQLLMNKLNYLKPHEQRLRITERSLHSMHSKNLRQINNSFQSNIGNILKNHPPAKLAQPKAKDLAQKQNMSDMVFRKYSHLINRI